MKQAGIVFLTVFNVLPLYLIINAASPLKNKLPPQNHAPVVKIVAPKNNSQFDWNTRLNYSITVSDKEDGESKYDEINTKEVLLQVKYIGNDNKVQQALSKGVQNDAPGLAFIRTSNCFNCHTFNNKAIGPSFYDISKKYAATPGNIALMVKRIREGSSGVWDKTPMPSHTELTNQQIQKMVQWIMQNATDPNNTYYTGAEGSFHTQSSSASRKTVYMLTASYTDHGTKVDSTHRLKGQDIIFIHSK